MSFHDNRPKAGSFRTRLEITNRSGWVTRDYRLILLPDGVRVVYATGRTSYDIHFDPDTDAVICTCPAFDADGSCKHRDAVLALRDALVRRLGKVA